IGFRELLEDTGSRTWVFVGKGNESRADKSLFGTFKGSAFNSATGQGIADHFHPYTTGSGLSAQGIHLADGDATGVDNHGREGGLGSLLDFSDNRFLVFKSYSHKFSPKLC